MNHKGFLAACAAHGCRRQGLCLPATMLDPARKTHTIRARANWVTTGYWTRIEPFYVYLPEGTSLQTALRRHRKASEKAWQPVCVRCLGAAYAGSAHFDVARGQWIGSIFGKKLSARLRDTRGSMDPERALDRLVPRLEAAVARELERLAQTKRPRRAAPVPACESCGTLKATEFGARFQPRRRAYGGPKSL